MAINLPPIANPEKVGSFNTNFKMIQDELNNVIRRGGLGVGEPNHMEVDLDMNGNAILNASTDLGNSKSLITVGDADKRYLEDVSADIAGKVDKAGDTMSGTLDMGSNLIRSLLAPLQDNDAATKKYIDDIEASLKAYVDTKIAFMSVSIGDYIGGGVYGGTHTDGTKSWHLIFAKQDGEADGPSWGNYGIATGATDPDDGLANQTLILTSFDNGDSDAFYHCRDYVDAEGNNDYYLPALNELKKAQALLDMSHAEFSTDLSAFRWSSTEDSSEYAYIRTFSYDGGGVTSKAGTSRRTRPVRRVLI